MGSHHSATATPPGPDSTYGERLLWAMAVKGLNQSELARLVRVTPQSIQYLCDPANHARGSRNTAAFADACGVDPNWLARATGSPIPGIDTPALTAAFHEAAKQSIVPASGGAQRVPVLSYAQVGAMAVAGRVYLSQGSEEYITTDLQLSGQSFALEIKGDSMVAPPGSGEESFHEGDRIIVDCTVTPLPGDFVVVREGEHEASFRKYRPRGVDEQGHEGFEAVPLNPDYPVLRSNRQNVRIVGVMVEHRRYRRRG